VALTKLPVLAALGRVPLPPPIRKGAQERARSRVLATAPAGGGVNTSGSEGALLTWGREKPVMMWAGWCWACWWCW
jgi:hypothetical protein